MSTANDIYNYINSFAPFDSCLDFDNVGILVGSGEKAVSKIGVCLDITADAVKFAAENGIDLIVSHHPVIFSGLKQISDNSVVYGLIKNDICAVCAHTNLDAAHGGVNDCLCSALSLKNIQPLADKLTPGKPAIARIGELDAEMNTSDFAAFVKSSLKASGVKYCGGNLIKKVAVCGGAGADLIADAVDAGADAFVTSEVKQHEWIYAAPLDITVIDAGHFFTEDTVIAPLCGKLTEQFADVSVIRIPQCVPYNEL